MRCENEPQRLRAPRGEVHLLRCSDRRSLRSTKSSSRAVIPVRRRSSRPGRHRRVASAEEVAGARALPARRPGSHPSDGAPRRERHPRADGSILGSGSGRVGARRPERNRWAGLRPTGSLQLARDLESESSLRGYARRTTNGRSSSGSITPATTGTRSSPAAGKASREGDPPGQGAGWHIDRARREAVRPMAGRRMLHLQRDESRTCAASAPGAAGSASPTSATWRGPAATPVSQSRGSSPGCPAPALSPAASRLCPDRGVSPRSRLQTDGRHQGMTRPLDTVSWQAVDITATIVLTAHCRSSS